MIKMSKNMQILLKKTNTIFIVGMILSVISMFLPWYDFRISFAGENFNWIFYPLEGWTIENSYEFTPPDLTALTPYFYMIFVYAGIMLSAMLINMTAKNKQENITYFPYLVYFGVILSGFTLFLLLYLLVAQNFYFPYLQIDQIAGELVQTQIYSMSSGSIIAFFSVILLIFPACFIKPSYNYSDSEDEDQFKEEIGRFDSVEREELSENSLNLSPREEYQLLEDKFIETRMNTIKKGKKSNGLG
jgi:hypothetical protein